MNRTALNLVLMVAFVAGVWLLWRLRGDEEVVATPVQRSDYVLRDFELIALDEEGAESFTAQGPYLQRDVGGESLSMVQPRFTFPAAGGDGSWNARADNAWVSPGATEVHLLHDVSIVGPAGSSGTPLRVDTERLLVLPDEDALRSDHRVTITQGDSILAGTGLRGDMKAKRFELLDQVNARYVPR